MLTGRPPFQAASPVDTVLMVLEQDPFRRACSTPKPTRPGDDRARGMQKPAGAALRLPAAWPRIWKRIWPASRSRRTPARITRSVARLFRETHHATLLRNWGVLWMWHSLVLLSICLVTNYMSWRGVNSRWPYSGAMGRRAIRLGANSGRCRRRAGPVTAIERQIAHFGRSGREGAFCCLWSNGCLASRYCGLPAARSIKRHGVSG